METEIARQKFKDCGLSYDDIYLEQIYFLQYLITKHIRVLGLDKNELKFKLSKKLKYEFNTTTMINCFIKVDGYYFKDREAISFNRDGFIGFGGAFNTSNAQPFINAFLEWCDKVKEEKEVK